MSPGSGATSSKYRSVTSAALVRRGERTALPLLSCSASHGGCTKHVGSGEVSLYHLAGHLGDPVEVDFPGIGAGAGEDQLLMIQVGSGKGTPTASAFGPLSCGNETGDLVFDPDAEQYSKQTEQIKR